MRACPGTWRQTVSTWISVRVTTRLTAPHINYVIHSDSHKNPAVISTVHNTGLIYDNLLLF